MNTISYRLSMDISLLARLDEQDRALFTRWALGTSIPSLSRHFWTAITHAGGAVCTILLAIIPLLTEQLSSIGTQALLTLVISHLIVQVVKRSVGRPRPSRTSSCATLIAEPDQFSFPSGHSAAAMSVALAYAGTFPDLAGPLLAMAMAVGMSRVCLAVHYPGDVLAGQAIAGVTYFVIVW